LFGSCYGVPFGFARSLAHSTNQVIPSEAGQKSGSNPWTDKEFYALRQSDWADFFAQWQQYGCDTRHCVEIGCGAGRLTKQITGTFDQVIALDVSEDQIDYTRSRVDRQKNTNL